MKSLFSRFRGRETPPLSRTESSIPQDKGNVNSQEGLRPPCVSRTPSSSSASGPLRSSTPIAAMHSQSSSSSSDSARPRCPTGVGDVMAPPVMVVDGEEEGRGRTVSTSGEAVKKVTFRSPVPTPTASIVIDEIAPQSVSEYRSRTISLQAKRIASSPTKRPSPLPSQNGGQRSFSRQSLPLPKPIMIRKASMPPAQSTNGSPTKSAMSPTPSDDSGGGGSTRSYLPPPNSWSEMAEEELIANLGPRERTRQEVLWEIVSSEERYVQELIKLNETFCRFLLPPSTTSPSLNLFGPTASLARTLSPTASPTPTSPDEALDYLPIAAKFASSPNSPQTSATARMNAYHILTNGRPSEVGGSPSRKPSNSTLNGQGRSHQSLPPPARAHTGQQPTSFSATFNRMSYHPGTHGKLIKNPPGSRAASRSSASSSIKGKEVSLPEDLEKVLTVLAGGILEGHVKLAAALRRRYEDQYPLVRSLADVFTSHSYILREYATYILHLERALEQVDNALTSMTQPQSRRSSRRWEETDMGKLARHLLSLEELAAERGESGLVIALSKPFQRLLKYPLLFQNLLFNTDPSLKEYEATLSMVDEVEEIVRTIEDEKASSEEREKTRDVWARIEGLEKDKMLMAPKPNRLLVSETHLPCPEGEGNANKDIPVKNKKSFKRLSDILKGGGDVPDLWVVRFSDVSLLCERAGLTYLPVSTVKATASRSDSLPELSGKAKYATTGKRAGSIKARNLYRFVRLHEWHLKQRSGSTEGLLNMDDISRARSRSAGADGSAPNQSSDQDQAKPADIAPITLSLDQDTPPQPTKVPLKGDGGPSPARTDPRASNRREADTETMTSDRQSVMSFAFKGSDQIRPNPRKPSKTSIPPPANAANRSMSGTDKQDAAVKQNSGGLLAGHAANAKFANRLRSPEGDFPSNGGSTIRPCSRTRRSLPPAMAMSIKSGRATPPALSPTDRNTNTTTSRPAWNSGTSKPPSVTSARGVKGTAPPSSIAARKMRPNEKGMTTSGSEDSGVAGLWTAYREGGAMGTPKRSGGAVHTRPMGGRI